MAESDRVSKKDLYKEAWEGHNFEISHLWQRSIFLGAFMLAIAGGYGQVFYKMIFEATGNIEFKQHLVALGLCYLGMIFSMLWIMMAKGSKLWYEKYEEALNKFVWDSDLLEAKGKVPHHDNLPDVPDEKISDNLLSTQAGEYSVSRVNIAIGIIALLAYSFLTVIHFGKAIGKIFNDNLSKFQCSLYGIAQLIFILTVAFVFLKFLCKSGGQK